MSVADVGPPGNERRRPAARPATITSRKGDSAKSIGSRQVSWWSVHEHVAPLLSTVGTWPMVGTPAWCALPDHDPAKWAALLDAAQHWALRLEICQEARGEAGRAIAGVIDWPALSREINERTDFYATRPWLKRVAS